MIVRKLLLVGLVALGSMSAGCAARSDDIYAKDVQKVLETKGGDLAQCQAAAQQADPSAAGSVMVHFKVKDDTGEFTDPQVVAEKTTAPPALQQCVMQALPGLKLAPADNRPADANYEFVFAAGAGAMAGAEPAAAPSLPSAPPPAE